jgi:hypothetical protein
LIYIIQPDDFVVTGDKLTIVSGSPVRATSTTIDFAGGLSTLIPAVPEQYPVQPGDYIELNGGGLVTSIQGIGPGSPPLSPPGYNQLQLLDNPSTGQPVVGYRIIRGPRRVEGEDSVKLPQDVVVLVEDIGPSGAKYCLNLPRRPIPIGSSFFFYEILFSPSGSVIGMGTTTSDKIELYVCDSTRNGLTDSGMPTNGDPALVVVNIRTGAIAVQPVDPNGTPPHYDTFAQDPRASGM